MLYVMHLHSKIKLFVSYKEKVAFKLDLKTDLTLCDIGTSNIFKVGLNILINTIDQRVLNP